MKKNINIVYLNTLLVWKKFTPSWRRAGNENMNLFESEFIKHKDVENFSLETNMYLKNKGKWPVKFNQNFKNTIKIKEGSIIFVSALSPDMVEIAFGPIKHVKNQIRVLWLIDGWKTYWKDWLDLINVFKVDFIFCAYLENVKWLEKNNKKAYWLPFAIEPETNHCAFNKEYDIVQMGRIIDGYHNKLQNSNFIYKTSSSFKNFLFLNKALSYKEYCNVLSKSKYTLSYPSGYELDDKTRNDVLGFIPTNMRWYESMAAKSLPIGEIPSDDEFRKLFPNNKTHIIESNIDTIIEDMSSISENDRVKMINDNLKFILENHTYEKRVQTVIKQIVRWSNNE